MLRISKMTDYAVVLATHLAAVEGPHAARDLALQTQIPEPTASKLLKKLTRAGVVVSQRGAKGGYALARSPEQIGIHEVIEAIEGPIAVTECSDETTDSSCEYETNCGVRANWQRINLAVQTALSEITLADMAFPGAAELVLLARSSEEAKQRREAGPRSSDIH
ncbi:MAG TPA: SUF system Fe-S cluster assembly regulator [Polyangiales bacterium]|nr:SUF system Fe-S cluster assembly regulator [Polyangiales bacterium]